MDLKEGAGNEFQGLVRKPTEDDLMNVVWVVDSNQLPFYKVCLEWTMSNHNESDVSDRATRIL
jgi:hypothetical protein